MATLFKAVSKLTAVNSPMWFVELVGAIDILEFPALNSETLETVDHTQHPD